MTTTLLLDLRMVEGRLHGIARYALELARHVPRLVPDWRVVGLTGPTGLPEDLGPLRPSLELVPCRAPFLSVLEQPALAMSLAQLRPTLFHATSFSLPALWPGTVVATLHDANHLALAESYGVGQLVYYRTVVKAGVHHAAALLTVSEFSRRELGKHLGVDPHRFQVIPEGVSSEFRPPTAEALQAFRGRWGLPPRYLLAVGNPKPHKNLIALRMLAERAPVPLVLLAGDGVAEALGFPETTRALSRLPEEEMPLLYGGAAATLVPSRYEGFGFPVLEAMASGSPVLAADAGSLPELVGEAGVLLSPDEPAAWAEAARRLLRQEGMAAELRRKGLERAARYDWESCAVRTVAAYRRALEKPPRSARAS